MEVDEPEPVPAYISSNIQGTWDPGQGIPRTNQFGSPVPHAGCLVPRAECSTTSTLTQDLKFTLRGLLDMAEPCEQRSQDMTGPWRVRHAISRVATTLAPDPVPKKAEGT